MANPQQLDPDSPPPRMAPARRAGQRRGVDGTSSGKGARSGNGARGGGGAGGGAGASGGGGGGGAGRGARSARTRGRLLEAAGQLFAEQGVDRVTGQQICRRAAVHSAAIVYHFGGMAGLYPAVMAEAQRRLLTTEALTAAVGAESDPRRKLRAFIGQIVQRLASPVSESWAARLFSREFVAPSAIYGPTHDRILAERSAILRSIVAALCGLAPQDPAVARAVISIMAPCAVMLVFNRRKMSRLVPGLELTVAAAPLITRHLTAFALGGLRALGAARGTHAGRTQPGHSRSGRSRPDRSDGGRSDADRSDAGRSDAGRSRGINGRRGSAAATARPEPPA